MVETDFWNQLLTRHHLSSVLYHKDVLTETIYDSNQTVIHRLNDLLKCLAVDYWNYLTTKNSEDESSPNEFNQMEESDKWNLMLNKYKLPYSAFLKANDILKLVDEKNINRVVTHSSTIQAISTIEELMISLHISLDKMSHLDLIKDFISLEFKVSPKDYEFISESQLKDFWKSFIIHHDLKILKYEFDAMKTTISYNTQATINLIDIFIRYVAYTRMNYLVIKNKKKLLDSKFFTLKTLKAIWDTLSIEYKLPKMEYEKAMYIEKVLKKAKSDFIPKSIVNEAFKSLSDLMRILFVVASNYSLSLKQSTQVPGNMSVKSELLAVNKDEKNLEQPEINIQKEILEEDVESNNIDVTREKIEETKTNELEDQQSKEVKNKSKFIQKLKILQTSSKDSVVNAESFGDFQKYMHVVRKIETDILATLTEIQNSDTPQLLLLCGSVGDGKSHLLAYIKENYPESLKDCIIHNDATESNNPSKSSLETLEELLQGFNDNGNPSKHIIVAINLGVLHNFYSREMDKGEYQELCKFIEESGVFSELNTNNEKLNTRFKIINFSKERNFTINKDSVISDFYLEIIKKVTANVKENEIYTSWKEDMVANRVTIAHENYALLMNEKVQKRIIEKLIHVILRNKIIISTRAFYNFIFDILVPTEQLLNTNKTAFSIKNTLPNLLFSHPDRSVILETINELDPVNENNQKKDEFVTNLLMSSDILVFLKEYYSMFANLPFENIIKKSIQQNELIEIAQFTLRFSELVFEEEGNSTFSKYIEYLYAFYKGEETIMGDLFEQLERVVYKWKGSPKEGYVYISNNINKDFRIATPLKLDPVVDEDVFGSEYSVKTLTNFNNFIRLGFSEFYFELDLRLYELLSKVNAGYRPNNLEINNAIQFEEFYNSLIKFAEENEKEILLIHPITGEKFTVSKPKFSKSKYEVKRV